jgi:hypothetical protein
MVPVNLSFLSILQDILRWVMESVLMPVIKDVFNILVELIGELIMAALSGILLEVWVILLKLIDFLEDIFSIFSGLTQLTINGKLSNQGIVQYLFGLGTVQKAFWMIMGISLVLCMVATIISVLRSMADSPFENKKPISAVLRTSLKCCLTFALLQFACLFAIQMITQVMLQVNYNLNSENSSSSLGDLLFYMLAQNRHKSGNLEAYKTGAKYANVSNVTENFDYMHFNWIIILVATVFMLGILLATIIGSIQRLFMLMILYIISPIFVAYMPLDEGKSFGQWRDTFVAYLVSGLSPIITMRLYMMFLPMLIDTKHKFSIAGLSNTEMIYVNLLFLIGGSFAIFSSRNLILKVINPALAGQLDGNSAMGSMLGKTAFGKGLKAVSMLKKG